MRKSFYLWCALVVTLLVASMFMRWAWYAIPFVLLAWALGYRFAECPKNQRAFLLKVFGAALLLRITFALALHATAPDLTKPFFFLDDETYHRHGSQIAADWQAGVTPALSSEVLVGSLHTGYYRVIGAVYYIFGPRPGLIVILNCVLGALLVPVVFFLVPILLSGTLFKSRNTILTENNNHLAAYWAAVVTALHPLLWYWSAFILKDTLHAFFFAVALWLYLESKRKRTNSLFTIMPIVTLCSVLAWLTIVRAYTPMILIVTIFLAEILWGRWRKLFLLAAAVGLTSVVLAAILYTAVFEIIEQVAFSFLNLVPDAVNTPLNVYRRMATSLPRFFLSPYGWIFLDRETLKPVWDISYYSYPGIWVNYILIFPLALWGVWKAFREDLRGIFLVLIPLALQYYLYMITFGGSAPRQMVQFIPFFIILAALGNFHRPNRKFLIGYYTLLGVFILTHIASVILRLLINF